MKAPKTKIFLVDDHEGMRTSLRKLLEYEEDFEVCGEAGTVEEAFRGIQQTHPDAAIVDLILGSELGFDLISLLKNAATHVRILILSMHAEVLFAKEALQKGAMGYLMKSSSPDQILAAIRQILAGKIYLSPEMELLKSEKEPHHE